MPYKPSLYPKAFESIQQAWYFHHEMMHLYHHPFAFFCSLNAFIQAIYNCKQYLVKEIKEHNRGSEAIQYLASKMEEMKENILLINFHNARNIIVHQTALKRESKANLGLYRGNREKFTFNVEVSPFSPSVELMRTAKKLVLFNTGESLKAHHENGLQVGFKRIYYAKQLGNKEVLCMCTEVLNYFIGFMAEVYSFKRRKLPMTILQPKYEKIQIITEFTSF